MAQKTALGKGLASLLPGAANAVVAPPRVAESGEGAGDRPAQDLGPNKDRHPGISLASIDDIVANEYQPRRGFDDAALQELADSIVANGIIQPLVVRKVESGYQLIAGERRLRAARMAGLRQVPIVIRKSTDREALELALVENIQRQDLNCIDTALAYFQLIEDFALTQEEAARRVGKDRTSVANHLRLLRLPEQIIEDLRNGVLSFGHGRALLGLEENDLRLLARKEVIEKGLSVRDTEALVEQLKAKRMGTGAEVARTEAGAPQVGADLRSRFFQIGQDLTRRWSTKVEVKGSDRRGKIILHFASRSELERILSAMQNQEQWLEKST